MADADRDGSRSPLPPPMIGMGTTVCGVEITAFAASALLFLHAALCRVLNFTRSIPNYKSFQEPWRVKAFLSLIKIIEKNTKICNVK